MITLCHISLRGSFIGFSSSHSQGYPTEHMNSFSLGMDLLPPAVIPILMKRDVQSKLDVKDLLSEPDLRELNKSLATLIPKTNASLEGQAFQ